jgi:hypothetical protein
LQVAAFSFLGDEPQQRHGQTRRGKLWNWVGGHGGENEVKASVPSNADLRKFHYRFVAGKMQGE